MKIKTSKVKQPAIRLLTDHDLKQVAGGKGGALLGGPGPGSGSGSGSGSGGA